MRAGKLLSGFCAAIVLAATGCGTDSGSSSSTSSSSTSTTTTTAEATTATTSTSSSGPGGGGVGGQGGETTGQGGASEGGGGAGEGGGCVDPEADCPPTGDECQVALCDGGACVVAPAPAMTPVSVQVAGDCMEVQCDGAGATVTVPVITDPPDDSNECTLDTCSSGTPVHTLQPSKTLCSAGVCDGLGLCVECVDSADCSVGACQSGICNTGNCPVGTVDMGSYCIDATEVSNAQYAAFLGKPDPGQDAVCAWNTSYVPSIGIPPSDNLPVTRVDWCDAAAYCKAAGKRLCGGIAGGTNAFSAHADASKSQWYNACSNGGATTYPYGSAYQSMTCNASGPGAGNTVAVGQSTMCRGTNAPYDGVYDMSGNVWEWEDSCSANAGAGDNCRLRGGAFNTNLLLLPCATNYFDTRSAAYSNVGFRCCSP